MYLRVTAGEIQAFVTVVPADVPGWRTVGAAHFEHFAVAVRLSDVMSLDDDAITDIRTHGNPPDRRVVTPMISRAGAGDQGRRSSAGRGGGDRARR
jgi:hypothetical protein